jgi:hypothetical protein
MKSRKSGQRGQALKKGLKKRVEKRSARQSRNTKRADDLKKALQRVDEFAKTHPGFDALAKEIIFWIEKKLPLESAYRVAKVLDRVNVKLGRATL